MQKHLIATALCLALLGYAAYQGTPLKKVPASPVSQTILGFIRAVDLHTGTISFDDAVWLSGKEGEDAAIKAGICTEATRGECLPNDYFILNTATTTIALSLSPTLSVTMQTWKMEEEGSVASHDISPSDFSALINNREKHWKSLPYNVVTEGGKVTRIDEVYVP